MGEECVELQLLDLHSDILAGIKLSPDMVSALKLHLEAGRDCVLGYLPNCTVQ